jgi:hypothetical protein
VGFGFRGERSSFDSIQDLLRVVETHANNRSIAAASRTHSKRWREVLAVFG